MLGRVLLVAALTVMLLASMAKAAAVVRLQGIAEVEDSVIRLGRIAQIETDDPILLQRLSDLEVGPAALPGLSRQVSVGSITLRIRQARLDTGLITVDAVSDPVEVKTKAQTVRAETVASTVRTWYEERLAVPPDARLLVEVEAEDVVVGTGELDIHLVAGSIDWGRNTLTLQVQGGQAPAKRVRVSATASVMQQVFVASRNISRGEVLGAADVVEKEMTLTRPIPAVETGAFRATRFIREGSVIDDTVIEPVPLIGRGDRVRVEASVGRVRVHVVGVAMEDGWLGDDIAVRNESSGAVFRAEVIGAQVVRTGTW